MNLRLFTIAMLGLLCAGTSNAQYHPLVVNDHVWKMTNFGLVMMNYNEFIEGDTLVNDIVMRKLHNQMIGSDDVYDIALLWEDVAEQKVYFFDGTESHLLYDFDVQVGEVVSVMAIDGINNVTISAIETIQVNGTDRKKISITGQYTSSYWIEGIGSPNGIMDPIMGLIVDYFPVVTCFYASNDLNWDNPGDDITCGTTLNVDERGMSELVVFPNPASTIVNVISNQSGIDNLALYDGTGKLITTNNLRGIHLATIDVSVLPDGIYHLSVRMNNGQQVSEKILLSH